MAARLATFDYESSGLLEKTSLNKTSQTSSKYTHASAVGTLMNRRTFIARSFGTASLAVTHSLWPRATLLAQDGAPMVRIRLEDLRRNPVALRLCAVELQK